MANGNKIITRSNVKTMIRHGELVRVLNETEIQQWHHIIAKVEKFQEQELERSGRATSSINSRTKTIKA